jgi:hypothetical protein
MNKYACYCPVCKKTHTIEIDGRLFNMQQRVIDNKSYTIWNCGRHTFNEFRNVMGMRLLEPTDGNKCPKVIGEYK